MATFERFISGLQNRYEPQLRQHLAKVYMLLGATTGVTAIGSVLQMYNYINLGYLAGIASVGFVLALHFMKDNGKNYDIRLGMLLAFGFCSGQSLGPLLTFIIAVNPSVIFTALAATAVIFASLSISALLAERGKYMFLGGLVISIVNTMAIISLLNIYFRSYFVQLAQLYIGVFVMAGFILFDTQNIIENYYIGNRDVVQHALDLFFNVLNMFKRLLIILTQKEQRRSDNRKKR